MTRGVFPISCDVYRITNVTYRINGDHDWITREDDFMTHDHDWMIHEHDFMIEDHDWIIDEHEFIIHDHDWITDGHDAITHEHDFMTPRHHLLTRGHPLDKLAVDDGRPRRARTADLHRVNNHLVSHSGVSAIAMLFQTEMVRVPTQTEAFVHDVCRKSFLSLWSYASPQGRTAGKEMCDILVLCEPDIIIFSVKEVKRKRTAPDDVRFKRWVRGAVDESVAQIYGAERFIQSDRHPHVVQESGAEGLPYPKKGVRRIHRVAVALGGDDHFAVPFGEFGKGFVHVFDERSFNIVTAALNTIKDLVAYLEKKEALFSTQTEVLFGLEEDLLAIYLHGNRSFPDSDLLVIEEGAWPQFIEKPEVKAKWAADNSSFIWDRLTDRIGRDVAARNMLVRTSPR